MGQAPTREVCRNLYVQWRIRDLGRISCMADKTMHEPMHHQLPLFNGLRPTVF
jgi:hypothetical protein